MFTLQLEQFRNLLTDRSILMWSVHDMWDKGYHDSMCLKSGCLGKREQELAWFLLIVVSYPPLIYGSGIFGGEMWFQFSSLEQHLTYRNFSSLLTTFVVS